MEKNTKLSWKPLRLYYYVILTIAAFSPIIAVLLAKVDLSSWHILSLISILAGGVVAPQIIFLALGKKTKIKALLQQFAERTRQIEKLKNRQIELYEEIDQLKQEINRHRVASELFRDFLGTQMDKLHEIRLLRTKTDINKLRDVIKTKEAAKQTLAIITKLVSDNLKEDLAHFSCTTMMPGENKCLFIKHHYNYQNETPRSFGQPYSYKSSCAGYAWYRWEEAKRERFFVLSNVPQHLKDHPDPDDPERHFELKHQEQLERHKSIISIVLYHQFKRDTIMLGVLNLSTSKENCFTQKEYKEKLEPLLLSYVQAIDLCYFIDHLIHAYMSSSV